MKTRLFFLVLLACTEALTFCQFLPGDFVANYPFNGNPNDISENGLNAVVEGSTLVSDRLHFDNSAYSFTNGLITFPLSGFEMSSPQFTITWWVKVPQDKRDTLIESTNANDLKMLLRVINNTYQLEISIRGNKFIFADTAGHCRIFPGYPRFDFMAVKWIDNQINYTINEYPIFGVTLPDSLRGGQDPFSFSFNPQFKVNCTIDDIHIFKSALIGFLIGLNMADTINKPPILTSDTVLSVGRDFALLHSNVSSTGGSEMIETGFYYGTEPVNTLSPQIKGCCGDHEIDLKLGNLMPDTRYYVMSYASNYSGYGFGKLLTFKTLADINFKTSSGQEGDFGLLKDVEGNEYKTIKIGNQTWMAENLRVTKYSDGRLIPNITDNNEWNLLNPTEKAYCYYNNDPGNATTYGALYTWSTATDGKKSSSTRPSQVQGVCPSGWHLPSDVEWEDLAAALGGKQIAGGKMKEPGLVHWIMESGATNESHFTGLPGGNRYNNYFLENYGGAFSALGQNGLWWSATEYSSNKGDYAQLNMGINDLQIGKVGDVTKGHGQSVRCLKDENEYPGNDTIYEINIALHKPVTQSSTQYGSIPEKAVDGNTDGIWDHGSVSHTYNNLNAWIEIDLGGSYNINTVELWNRTDNCCKSRLNDFYLVVSDVPFQSKELMKSLQQQNVWSVHRTTFPDPADTFNVNRTGRFIRVQAAQSIELNIAEIKVMGSYFKPSPIQTNIALHKKASQSSTQYEGTANRAVDGNTSGHWQDGSVSHTYYDKNAWWEVDLGDAYKISSIEIWNRTDNCCKERLSNYFVLASESPFISKDLNQSLSQSGVWFSFDSQFPAPSKKIDISMMARYIRVQCDRSAELNLAEVIVNGIPVADQNKITNIAYNKPATQSSTQYGGVAERAVDGNTNGEWDNGSVTHTFADMNAWWQVDLGGVYEVDSIYLWNRTDPCCIDRLSDFYVFVSDDPFISYDPDFLLSHQNNLWTAVVDDFSGPYYPFHPIRTGRYIRIQSQHTTELSLAEIEVRGKPRPETFKSTQNVSNSESIKKLDIQMYPVPFSDILHIESKEVIRRVEVFTLLGETVFLKEFNSNSIEFNTELFRPSWYIARITTNTGTVHTYSIIKTE